MSEASWKVQYALFPVRNTLKVHLVPREGTKSGAMVGVRFIEGDGIYLCSNRDGKRRRCSVPCGNRYQAAREEREKQNFVLRLYDRVSFDHQPTAWKVGE